MCIREICHYEGCMHTIMQPDDPIEPCRTAQLAGILCNRLTIEDYVDQTEPFCKFCEFKLAQRLEQIQRLQETGWQWSLPVYNLQSRRRTSMELERMQNEYESGAMQNGDGSGTMQNGDESERIQNGDDPENLQNGDDPENLQNGDESETIGESAGERRLEVE